MRNFGDSRRISGMMTRLGMEDNEGLQHPWLNRTVETAQKRVEQRNYQIRKHTLQYDDVMNQQRMVIYTNRMDIIESEDCRPELFNVVDEVIEEEVASRLEPDHPDAEGLLRWLNSTMPLGLRKEDIDWKSDPASISTLIKERVKKAYELKNQFENPAAVQSMERMILLNAIDRPWQEHLYAMDGLRTSIGLRAYAQKDPLIEYKQEAYSMFEELMRTIKRETVHNLFRSTTNLAAFEDFLRNLPQFLGRGPDPVLDAPAAPQPEAGTEPAPAKPEITLPIHRDIPKIGRNDMVTIRKGSETQTLKFKKAEPLLSQGWTLVNK